MTRLSNAGGAAGSRRLNTSVVKRTKRKRQYALESLESRTLLAYTFTYVAPVATAVGTAAVDSLVISPIAGLLEHSVNGGAFDPNWGGLTVPAALGVTVDVTLSSGDGSSFQLGGNSGVNVGGPASLSSALFVVDVPANTTDTALIDDSASASASTYTINAGLAPLFPITGPGIDWTEPAGIFDGGITLQGSGADGDTVNVLSTFFAEPVKIANNGSATVNVGSAGGAGTMADIQGTISVSNPPSLTALNFHDENDATGRTWTLDNNDGVPSGSVAVTGGATTSYDPFDLSSLTINGGSGGNTFNVNNTSAFYLTGLNTGTANDTVNVFATGASSLIIHGQSGLDTVTLGASLVAPLGMQGLTGTIGVDNLGGFTALTLDDSQDTTGQTATLTDDGITGTVTGLSPATITYFDAEINSLTFDGASGGNTFTVNGTIHNVNLAQVITTLNTGTGVDTTNVLATDAIGPLVIHGFDGLDTVNVGDFGSVLGVLGDVTIDNTFDFTTINVDASADAGNHTATLSGFNDSTLTGLAPANVIYHTSDASSLTVDTNHAGNQVLNVDFSTGNPIPAESATGLIFNAGADFGDTLNSHILNLFGTLPSGPFASEVHNANDHTVFPQIAQYGSIAFVDSLSTATGLNYTGLLPINDTAPAVDYTFNDFADDQSFKASDGPVVMGFNTIQFANAPATPPPTFETTNVANKTNVTFNTTVPSAGITGVVDITTPSTGLATLTFNTPTDNDNQVSFVNTPPGVVTTLNGGSDEDVTNVTGQGVPAGTTLVLNGGGGIDTLNYDAGGLTPTVTAGGAPGEVIISLPGFGSVDATNYEVINLTSTAPLVITPGPAVTINSVEGFNLADAIVGTFTAPIPIPGPAGFPASDFTASIDWGDPTPDPAAGTITQDATNPSVYYITGTHTFPDTGTFTVANTVAFAGATISTTVNGVTVSVTFPPAGPTAGNPATANVTQGPLAVSAFPIVGTEGATIVAGPIATFIDAAGADLITDYSATINITNSSGFSLVLPAASITQNGNAAQFTVNAPAFTLPEEGTYQVVVSVTDNDSATPITTSGASHAVIADAALTASVPVAMAPNTGVPLSNVLVAIFTDANTGAPASDFTAVIDWGDGSPNSIGTIVGAGGNYNVDGTHTYAKPGVFTTTVNVLDVGGSAVTLLGSANVTDLPVTGATHNFTAVEGQNTGTFVLATFTDPNPGATVADVSAELAIGGWGDGTPGVPGIALVVQQIGATANFEVLGSHTYAEETPPGLPDTLSVVITTLGGVTTTLTSPPGGGVTVLDATLTGFNNTTVAGVEGIATGSVLIGTFRDANQGADVADFTSGTGSVVVDWGDGSMPETLAAANLTAIGSPTGVVFSINASHIFPEEAQYPIAITVTDTGGATTIISSTAVISDAVLTAGAATLLTPSTGVPLPATTVVGTFTDANPTAPISDFTATIDWGDGSPNSVGTVTQPGGVGTAFDVTGGHTYAKPGVYTTTITVVDDGGEKVIVTGSATVTDLAVTGTTNNFTATEGKNTGLFVLATFTDPNTLATVADVKAELAIGGWGDGTPGVAGIPLVVQEIGASPAGPVFQVLGSHTYAEETPAGLPDTLSVVITTLGGAVTTLTSPPGGGVTVLDAALSSSNGTSITGTEGIATPATTLIGTFTDTNQGATSADFLPLPGGNGGSIVVNWGDGSAPETLTAANITASGSANGVVFSLTDSHLYVEEGSFAITITVTDDGGATTIISSTAIISAGALSPLAPGLQPIVTTTEASLFPVPVFAPPVFKGPVASFTDTNPVATVTDFQTTIDWGDGTPPTAGTVSQPGGAGTAFVVSGSHTYADSGVNGGAGTYAIQVFIVDVDGDRLVVDNTATVADNAIVLTGKLDPSDDTGLSNFTPNVTSVTQPRFFGYSEPFSHVSLVATSSGGASQSLGTAQAGSEGFWDIGSQVRLADGTYKITATAVDQFGVTTTTSPVTIVSNLVIDTTGPVITSVFFNRLNGEVDYVIQDPPPASGVNVASLEDSSNYLFTKVHANRAFTGKYLVTSVIVTPGAAANSFDVAVVINSGRPIPGGFYLFTIRSSSEPGGHGVQDTAENLLDGEFFGTFPSGDGLNSTDFVAMLSGFHNKIFAPQTILGTASPNNGGNGGPPIGAVHSGLFTTVVPVGGGSVFGSDPKHLFSHGKVKTHKAVEGRGLVKHHAVVVKLHGANHQSKTIVGKQTPKGPRHG